MILYLRITGHENKNMVQLQNSELSFGRVGFLIKTYKDE